MDKTIDLALITAKMKHLRISYSALGKRLGVCSQAIYFKLAGLNKFTPDEIYVVSRELGVSTEDLYCHSDLPLATRRSKTGPYGRGRKGSESNATRNRRNA